MDEPGKKLDDLVKVVEALRKDCPWDSVQTHESLIPFLRNETREVEEGIAILKESGNGENLCEELGDVLFQVILQSIIAQEEGIFTLEDVIMGISSKMKYRHPRIFAPEDQELASLSWDELKQREKEAKILDIGK